MKEHILLNSHTHTHTEYTKLKTFLLWLCSSHCW